MPKFHVERSIEINTPAKTVHESLTDFRQWPAWSPWLYTEPDAQVEYRGQSGQIGHGYDWQGKLTGEGGMTLIDDNAEHLKMDLTFLKPFKSEAKVRFDIADLGSGNSRVTWHIDSSLPFFMFFMTKTMTAMIGADYDRGLRMLKEKLETGSISSSTTIEGIVDFDGSDFVGIAGQCSMSNFDPMKDTFQQLMETAETAGISTTEPALAIYTRMDLKNSHCEYVAALPVTDLEDVPEGLQPGHTKSGRAFKVVHTGNYKHLGNAWATAIAQQRDQKLKPSKDQPAFERYIEHTDPEANANTTEIYIPLR